MTGAITALPLARVLLLLLALASGHVHGAQAGSWFDGERPGAQARSAVALLQSAAENGLEPQDYNAQALAQSVQRLVQAPMVTPSQRSRLDAALTEAMQRYLADLSTGRIAAPRSGGNYGPTRRSTIDIAALMQTALAGDGLEPLARQLAQQVPMSTQLGKMLAHYRTLENDSGWITALPVPRGGKLEAGQTYAGMATLVRRLTVLGDLEGDTALPTVFDTRLTAAIARFQQRHGLLADGVVGRNTLAQLAVTPRQRARQIVLTMERMRWTPLLQAPRMIVVNVPEFVLRAYEVRQDQIDVRLTMNIIVGNALDTRTPLFDEDMRFIEFSPNWNVPYSIASKELVPRLRKEPDYFTQQGFEFVTDTGTVVGTLRAEHLDAVMAGTWRIRQRPGPKNALGDIKFIFPNNDAIFLHHTPSPGLFARPRRDFSHGCVRVEAPVALARFVLQDDPAWTDARIREAMALGKSRTIRLQQTIPVLLAYHTVVIKQGMAFFLADIYGHDAALDQALQDHSRAIRQADLP